MIRNSHRSIVAADLKESFLIEMSEIFIPLKRSSRFGHLLKQKPTFSSSKQTDGHESVSDVGTHSLADPISDTVWTQTQDELISEIRSVEGRGGRVPPKNLLWHDREQKLNSQVREGLSLLDEGELLSDPTWSKSLGLWGCGWSFGLICRWSHLWKWSLSGLDNIFTRKLLNRDRFNEI